MVVHWENVPGAKLGLLKLLRKICPSKSISASQRDLRGGGSDAAAATNPALLHHVSREYGSDSNAPAEPAVYLHADGLTVCNDEHYPMLRDVMGAFVGRKIFAHWASNGRRKCVGTLQLKGLEKEVSCGGCVSVVVVELNLN